MDDFQGDSMTSRFNWAIRDIEKRRAPSGHHPGSTHGKMLEKSSWKGSELKTKEHTLRFCRTWQLKIYHLFFGMYKKNTGIFQCHVSSEWSLFPCESNEVTEGSRKLQVFFTKVKRYGETSPKKCWHNHEITMIVMDSKPPLHKRKTHTSHCSVIEEQHLYKPNPGFAIITWNNPKKIGETLHHQGTCYLSIFRMDFPM